MTKIELIINLEKAGTLNELFKQGFVSWKIMRDKDIFLTFDTKLKMGKSNAKAINETASEFDIDALMVRRAIKSFK